VAALEDLDRVLRLDVAAVMRDGDLLGRMLDTLVAAQLHPELALSRARPRLFITADARVVGASGPRCAFLNIADDGRSQTGRDGYQ
jgi:hypothetical protein